MIGIIIGIIVIVIAIYLIFFNKKPDINSAKTIRLKAMATKQVSIENIVKTDDRTYEFDVFIEGDNFELTSYQGALGFNESIVNGGTLTFQYLTGTCEINNPPAFGLGVNSTDGPMELTFGSGPGSDFITDKKRLGKFRLSNTNDFTTEDIDISWNFTGFINTIFTGEGFNDITNTLLFTIIVGGKQMITINENQRVLLTAEALSAKGNIAPIDGPVVWTVTTGSQFVTLTPVDDLSVYVVAIGPIGNAIVEASADADLGSGQTFITNTIEVEVIGGQAITLNIIPGIPEEQL